MNDFLDINKLMQPRRRVAEKRNITYSKVLELCHRRIKFSSIQRPNCNWCIYEIPNFILGFPRFNIEICARYCLAKLRTNGFEVTFVPSRTIIVSWQHIVNKKCKEARKKRKKIRRERREKYNIKTNECAKTSSDYMQDYLDAPLPRYEK